jgi:nucleoside diphosphate kinase
MKERALPIIKPDDVARDLIGEVIKQFEQPVLRVSSV